MIVVPDFFVRASLPPLLSLRFHGHSLSFNLHLPTTAFTTVYYLINFDTVKPYPQDAVPDIDINAIMVEHKAPST
jgi:hypothetical protein